VIDHLLEDELLDAVRSARPAVPEEELSPAGAQAQAVLDRVHASRRRPARSVFRRGMGVAPVLLAVGTTLAVVAVAIVTLRPHTPAGAGRSTGIRGEILDRNGEVLAKSSTHEVTYLQIIQSDLPRTRSARAAELEELSRALKVQLQPLLARSATAMASLSGLDITPGAGNYVARHERRFPGVEIARNRVRAYPQNALAAQVLGTVGPFTARDSGDHGVAATAAVGQSGLEGYYNSVLRSGDTLKTTLDVALQRVGQRALQHAIDANYPANGGAFVALDPENGQVYAMGSLPTYNANVFSRPIPTTVLRRLFSPSSGDPLVNRATQSASPIGSTFAPITALAALESGAWSVGDTFDDTGQFCFQEQCRHNSGHAVDGVLDLADALQISSNDFFYNLGALTGSARPAGALDAWARVFGIGQKTGVDLPGESAGTLPTPKWRAQRYQLEAECDAATGPYAGRPKHPPGGCGIADGTNRPWSVGDNESLAAGQGDVQVTPLQLAVIYAAIANGGKIVTPHLGLAIERPNGAVLRQIDPAPTHHPQLDPLYLNAVRTGLRAAASQPGGTSDDVFGSFPEQVYGATGSAQITGHQDDAWYAGYVPASATAKPVVVVVTVQQGGFGARAAAPVARQILSQWFFGHPGPWISGTSRTL
jgi:penicillin-binding protein 2